MSATILIMMFLICTPLWILVLVHVSYWCISFAIDCYYYFKRPNNELLQDFQMDTTLGQRGGNTNAALTSINEESPRTFTEQTVEPLKGAEINRWARDNTLLL